MFQIKCDNYIIYDPRDSELTVSGPKLTLEVNKAGSLRFTVYRDHPYFESMHRLTSIVEVFKDDKVLFRGRILETSQGIYNEKEVICEGALAYLQDSMVRPGIFSCTPAEFFIHLITAHNEAAAPHQKLNIGKVETDDTGTYVWDITNYYSTWEVMQTMLMEQHGGYVIIRPESDGNYIDYVTGFAETAQQKVEFGENLLDITQQISAAETYTAILPLGKPAAKKDVGEDIGDESVSGTGSEYFTIESVNNGCDYIVDDSLAETYGVIFAPVSDTTWEEISGPAELLSKAQEYLANVAAKLSASIELTAVDLAAAGYDVDSFRYCQNVCLVSELHGIDTQYLLTCIEYDMANPQNTQITLGQQIRTLTAIGKSDRQYAGQLVNRTEQVLKDYLINQVNQVQQENISQTSKIEQDVGAIKSKVESEYIKKDDMEAYEKSIYNTIVEQTDNKYSVQFNKVNTLEDNLKKFTAEMKTFIDFTMDKEGRPLILLGKVDEDAAKSTLKLRITNERVEFIRDEFIIAYISGNDFHINSGDIDDTLFMGKFAFTPRKESDSLSFDYIGEKGGA